MRFLRAHIPLLAQLIIIPAITKLKLNEMLVLLGLTFLKIVSDAFSGLATTGWMYYIGKNVL